MSWEWVIRILEEYWPMFLQGALMTLLISLVATVAGFFIGLIISIIRTIPKPENLFKRIILRIVNFILSAYIEIFRGTPMMVQAMVIYYGLDLALGISIDKLNAALLIVSINTAAYMSEIIRGGILSIDKGQYEAAKAMGMSHFQTMYHIVLPQAIRNILPATGNEFVINIKDTSVLNIIQVTELFFVAKTVAGTYLKYFETFFIISVIYFILTFTVTRILRYFEKKMDGKDNYVIMYANQMQVESPEEMARKASLKD